MGFVKKFEIFPSSYLMQISQENKSHDILQRKNTLLDYKNKKLSRKTSIFSKGLLHGVGQKI